MRNNSARPPTVTGKQRANNDLHQRPRGPAYYKVCRTRAAPKHEAVQLRLVGVDEWMERMIDGVKERWMNG